MVRQIKLKWWQLALVSIAVSALGNLSGQPSKKQRRTYASLKQAPWAPPGWLFAPAWIFNNYFLIAALIKLVNEEKQSGGRKQLMVLQSLIWVIFFTFNYAYFRKKSPVLAAILSIGDASFAVASLIIARLYKKEFSNNYLPLALWTSFASTLAVYQALFNSDPVFNTRPLIKYAEEI